MQWDKGLISAEEAQRKMNSAMSNMSDGAKQQARNLDQLKGQTDKINESNKTYLKNAKERIDADAKAQTGLRGFTKSTMAMVGNIGATMAIGAGIDFFYKAWESFDKLNLITKSAQLTAMKDSINEFNTAMGDSKENTKTIESLSDEFKILSQGVDDNGHNVSLTAEQFSRYKDIVSELVSISPSLVQKYNAEGDAVINRNTAIEDAIQLQKDYAKQATATYLSEDSFTAIMKGSQQNMKDATKEMRKNLIGAGNKLGDMDVGLGAGGLTNQMQLSAYGVDQAPGASKISDSITKALGREIDLEKASATELRDIAKQRELILGNLYKEMDAQDGISKAEQEQYDAVKQYLDQASAGVTAFDAAAQPMVDWLQTSMSQVSDTTGESFMSKIPEAMQDSYVEGLRAIAAQGGTQAEMLGSAEQLANKMAADFGPGSKYAQTMADAAKIKEDFMNGRRDQEAVKETSALLKEQQGELQALANDYYATGDAVDAAIASVLTQQSIDLGSFAQENILDLANAFNPLIDKITEARTVKEKFDAAMAGGDIDTTVNSYKEMYDSMMDGYNNAGNGTQGFWNFAELTLGQTALKDFGYDIDSVNARLKELAPVMEKTESGTDAFFDLLAANRDNLNQIEGVTIAEDGSWDIPAEKYGEVARQLGIAEDLLVGCVDNARHWADVKLWDSPQKAVKAIKDMDTTFESAEGKAYAFYDTVAQQAQQAGLSGQEFTEYMEEIGKQVELIDLDKLNFDVGTDKGKKNAKEVADQLLEMNSALERNGKLDLTGTTAMFKDMGKTADETTHALEQFEAAGLLDTGDIDLEQFGGNIGDFVNQAFGAIDQNNPFEGMESSIDSMSASINNLVATLGGVPEDWLHIDGQIAKIDEASAKGSKMTQEQYDNARKIWQEERDHQNEILNNKNSTSAQRRQASENIEKLNRSGKALEQQAYRNGLTTDEQFERRMAASGDTGNVAAYEEEAGALNGLKTELNEASKAGAKFRDTQHGNIEQGKGQRQVLDWNTESLEKNKDALLSWSDEEITNLPQREAAWRKIQKQYDGSISTVDTMSRGFTGMHVRLFCL